MILNSYLPIGSYWVVFMGEASIYQATSEKRTSMALSTIMFYAWVARYGK